MTVDDPKFTFEDSVNRLNAEIMDQMRRIYSETAIDYAMNPRNMSTIEKADGCATITGPCGDTMKICITVRDDIITGAVFRTDGCGTSIACGGMVTELAKGKPVQEAFRIRQDIILNALGGLPDEDEHCALLAANTMRLAVHDYLNSRNQPWKRMYRTD